MISAISPVAKKATASVDQTLTCDIGDLTQAVVVSWQDSNGGAVTTGVGGYTVTQGSVVSGVQRSTLTITAATLAAALGEDAAGDRTWKCAATSTAYPDSGISTFSPLVVTFLEYGKFVESVHLK